MTAIRREDDDTYEITTTKGNFKTRWVVNCAGLGCGKIILSVAVMAIIITAPFGAFGMDMSYKKLLEKE